MSKARVSLLVVMAIALVTTAASAGRALRASEGTPALPVGSWSIQVQPDPGSPIPPGVNFAALTSDGIIVNSNVSGLAGIGSWMKVGSRSYGVTFSGFEVVNGQQFRFVIRSVLHLSLDNANLDGPFMTDLYAADGTHIAAVSGTVHGDRLAVLSMP